MGLDRGGAAWLNLEQVASIIQLHNTGRSIVTTLPITRHGEGGLGHGMDTHARGRRSGSGGDGRTDNTRRGLVAEVRPTALFRHKQEGISGIYPMSMPGHWRVMIVSHDLRQVLLLDPFGDGFTIDKFDSVKYSYSGYNVSTWTERLQTDGWNCGVWVAWVASIWTTYVVRGLEVTMDISEVI